MRIVLPKDAFTTTTFAPSALRQGGLHDGALEPTCAPEDDEDKDEPEQCNQPVSEPTLETAVRAGHRLGSACTGRFHRGLLNDLDGYLTDDGDELGLLE